jgi:hypothetical protein
MLVTMLAGIATIAATVVVVLVVQATAKRVLGPPGERTRDLAGSVLFRVSALHGLILALVFATEISVYNALTRDVALEADAVVDLFYDAARYGGAAQPAIQDAILGYLDVAAGAEWESLGQDGVLLQDAWILWDGLYEIVLDLAPQTARETALRDAMLGSIAEISDVRDLRAYHAGREVGAFFWTAAAIGILLVAAAYYPYGPDRQDRLLISLFAAYTGLILYMIFALSDPFDAPGGLRPDVFGDRLARLSADRAPTLAPQ